MNTQHTRRGKPAVTLLEMTVVILVLLTMISVGTITASKIGEWKKGRMAGETLRSVYAAQRMYLADHPTVQVSSITSASLLPYMTGSPTSMPTIEDLEGDQRTIIVNTSPPKIDGGGGASYDPSGSTTDSLWDVGQ